MPIWSDSLRWPSTVVFLDYDQDGDLDIFLGSEEVSQSKFLENTGDFTFLDATEGIGLDLSSGIQWASALDWDQDGATDLAVVETYDDRTLKIYQNRGGTFLPYLFLPLPAPLSGSPLPYDYDQNSTTDLLIPCKTGLFLLTDIGTPDLRWTPLLQGIQPLSLQIFDAGRNDTLDLLIQTPAQWFLWKDFEDNGPRQTLAMPPARLFPLPLTLDSSTDYLEVDATGNLRWRSSGSHITWLGSLPDPTVSLTKLVPLFAENGSITALGLATNGILAELHFHAQSFEWTPLLHNVQDFQIVSLAADSALQLFVLGSNRVFLYLFTRPILRFAPTESLSQHTCLLSRFQVYQGDWPSFYRPILSSDQIFQKWWTTLRPDSIVAFWGTGSRVSIATPITSDSILSIPLVPPTPSSAISTPSLLEIYPNPATQTTQIRYQLREPSLVELTLNTLTGQQIQVIERAVKAPGTYTITLDTSDLPPGHYLVNLRLDGETYQSKLIVLR